MRTIRHDKLFELIDLMEEQGILVSSVHGYRLSKDIFDGFRKNPYKVKEMIKERFDFEGEDIATANRIDDNRNRIEYRFMKEPQKQGLEAKIFSLKPRLTSGNLAVDIVSIIAFNLMGDRFKKGIHLPSWISLSDIIMNLEKDWVFMD